MVKQRLLMAPCCRSAGASFNSSATHGSNVEVANVIFSETRARPSAPFSQFAKPMYVLLLVVAAVAALAMHLCIRGSRSKVQS